MKTEHVNCFDKSIPSGSRKRHYINYNLHNGWDFWKTINYANKMFGQKPNYTEPDASKFFKKECDHEFAIEGYEQDVVCQKCRETCPGCNGFPGLGVVCGVCGTYEGF